MTAKDRLLFEAHGLRCTRQRTLVFETLRSTASHPTADELYQRCSEQMPGLSLATVYNALEKLVEVGLVQKLPGMGVNGSARYDAIIDDHPHARCTRSGRVADLPEEVADKIVRNIPKKLIRELEQQLGFRVDRIQIELLGEFDHTQASDANSQAEKDSDNSCTRAA